MHPLELAGLAVRWWFGKSRTKTAASRRAWLTANWQQRGLDLLLDIKLLSDDQTWLLAAKRGGQSTH